MKGNCQKKKENILFLSLLAESVVDTPVGRWRGQEKPPEVRNRAESTALLYSIRLWREF